MIDLNELKRLSKEYVLSACYGEREAMRDADRILDNFLDWLKDEQDIEQTEKPIEEPVKKPKVYLFCVPSTTIPGVVGFAVAEDYTVLIEHFSSSEDFSKYDLGLTSDCYHEKYDKYYPGGYQLEWADQITKDSLIIKCIIEPLLL